MNKKILIAGIVMTAGYIVIYTISFPVWVGAITALTVLAYLHKYE